MGGALDDARADFAAAVLAGGYVWCVICPGCKGLAQAVYGRCGTTEHIVHVCDCGRVARVSVRRATT